MALPKLQLTKNFNLSEFHCRDGTAVPNEYGVNVIQLAFNLQALRDHVGAPIKIISGYRSPSHNRKVGGASRSQHLYGKASDIQIPGKTPAQVKAIIEKLIKTGRMKNGGIGLYKSFVHYDIGPARRW